MFGDVEDHVIQKVVDYCTEGSVDFVDLLLDFKHLTQIVKAHVIIRNWHHNHRIAQKKGDEYEVS